MLHHLTELDATRQIAMNHYQLWQILFRSWHVRLMDEVLRIHIVIEMNISDSISIWSKVV